MGGRHLGNENGDSKWKSQSSESSSTSISLESVAKGHHVFNELWNQRRGAKFYLQTEDFNRCDCYHDCYAVAMVVDEETVGYVTRDVPRYKIMTKLDHTTINFPLTN